MISSGIGKGAYSKGEAARILGISPAMLKRWVAGYQFESNDRRVNQAPLWRAQYDQSEDEPVIGFRDLIEARTVRDLKGLGFGLPTIRMCLRTAEEIAGDTHPFSTKKLKTDGNRLYLEMIADDGATSVIDLKTRQHAFAKFIERTFLDLEFEDGIATRWWINPKKRTLVIDPERSFGQPITNDYGIPTYRLAQAVKAEGSEAKVARLFGIERSVVMDAVKFEHGLHRAA